MTNNIHKISAWSYRIILRKLSCTGKMLGTVTHRRRDSRRELTDTPQRCINKLFKIWPKKRGSWYFVCEQNLWSWSFCVVRENWLGSKISKVHFVYHSSFRVDKGHACTGLLVEKVSQNIGEKNATLHAFRFCFIRPRWIWRMTSKKISWRKINYFI